MNRAKTLLTSKRWATSPGKSAILAAVVLLAAGCATINPLPNLGLGRVPQEEAAIRDLMQWHSARVEVYRDFGTVFTARAVYLSDPIREAAVDWEARTRLLDPVERKALSDKMLRGKDGSMEFLLGFYCPADSGSLEAPDGGWRIFLEYPDGRQARATCLEAEPEIRKVYLRFLRWDLSWSRLYRVCFPPLQPAAGAQGPVHLVISGAGGRGDMVVKTDPPPPAAP